MKKSLLSVGAASLAAMFIFSGCISSEGEAYIAELDEFVTGSKALEKIEPTKHPVVDPLIVASTLLYMEVGGEMRETIETRFGAMYIISAQKALSNENAAWEAIAKGDKVAYDELFAKFEAEVFPKLAGCPNGVTAKLVFDELCDKKASYAYTNDYLPAVKNDKAKAEEDFKACREWIERGRKATLRTVSSIDWKRKEERRKQFKDSLLKLQASMGDASQKLQSEMTVFQGQLTELAKNASMKNYLSEIAPLTAKKAFASEAATAEINKQIEAIAAKPEYKKVLALQDDISDRMKLTGDALVVLGDKVGGQISFTAKAIPWMIESDNALQATEEDEKQ